MTPQTPTLPTSIAAELALCVRDIFRAVGEPAPVYFGKRFVNMTNVPRRVVFAEDRGKWTRDVEIYGGNKGYVGGESMGLLAFVWGAPAPRGTMPGAFSDEDAPFHDTDDATALRRRVINAVQRAAPGIVDPDAIVMTDVPEDMRYGQSYTLRFTVTTGVQRDAAIFALKNTPADPVSPPDPQMPPGAPASTVTTSVTSTTS